MINQYFAEKRLVPRGGPPRERLCQQVRKQVIMMRIQMSDPVNRLIRGVDPNHDLVSAKILIGYFLAKKFTTHVRYYHWCGRYPGEGMKSLMRMRIMTVSSRRGLYSAHVLFRRGFPAFMGYDLPQYFFIAVFSGATAQLLRSRTCVKLL